MGIDAFSNTQAIAHLKLYGSKSALWTGSGKKLEASVCAVPLGKWVPCSWLHREVWQCNFEPITATKRFSKSMLCGLWMVNGCGQAECVWLTSRHLALAPLANPQWAEGCASDHACHATPQPHRVSLRLLSLAHLWPYRCRACKSSLHSGLFLTSNKTVCFIERRAFSKGPIGRCFFSW